MLPIGKRDFADVIMDLEMGKLAWITHNNEKHPYKGKQKEL